MPQESFVSFSEEIFKNAPKAVWIKSFVGLAWSQVFVYVPLSAEAQCPRFPTEAAMGGVLCGSGIREPLPCLGPVLPPPLACSGLHSGLGSLSIK